MYFNLTTFLFCQVSSGSSKVGRMFLAFVLVLFCFWFTSVFFSWSTVDLSRIDLVWILNGSIPYHWFCLVCLGLIHIGFGFWPASNLVWFWFWVFLSRSEFGLWNSFVIVTVRYCFWFCLTLLVSWSRGWLVYVLLVFVACLWLIIHSLYFEEVVLLVELFGIHCRFVFPFSCSAII